MSKKVDIKKQPRLGMHKTMSLTVNGIKYRFFRSTVTMMVITVAIAFLMNSLAESLIKRTMADVSREEIKRRRSAVRWASRLSSPGSLEDIIAFSASLSKNSPGYKETSGFAKLSSKEFEEYLEQAKQANSYLQWFDELAYDDRRQLVHQALGADIFTQLQTESGFQRFENNLEKMKSLRFVEEDLKVLRDFLEKWDTFKEKVETIRQSRRAAIEQIADKIPQNKDLSEALIEADGTFGKTITEAGFVLPPDTAKIISEQSKSNQVRKTVEKRISEWDARKEIARKHDVLPQDVNSSFLWDELFDSESDAEWTIALINTHWLLNEAIDDEALIKRVKNKYEERGKKDEEVSWKPADIKQLVESERDWLKSFLSDDEVGRLARSQDIKLKLKSELDLGSGKVPDVLAAMTRKPELREKFMSWPEIKELDAGVELTPEQAVEMANQRRITKRYIEAERLCADVTGAGFMGLGKRMGWLLLVSLMVCIVGIANAMLMTVTERFREIATLKCLGALDGFIMMMFVFEAAILGVIGGFFGSVVGGIIGVGRMHVAFGNILWPSLRAGDILIACVIAMIMGVIMAAVAAVYPSFKASRMAPMEAMRID